MVDLLPPVSRTPLSNTPFRFSADHAGPGDGQLERIRLHKLRELRSVGRSHRRDERPTLMQSAGLRLVRVQKGRERRTSRLGGGTFAGGAEPALAGGPTASTVRGRPASAAAAERAT